MGSALKAWFNRGYAQLLMYLSRHVGLDLEPDYISPDGFELGKWIIEIRKLWLEGSLTKKQEYQVEQIGLAMKETTQDWESVFRYARNYYLDNTVLPTGKYYRTDEGVILGAWIDRQKRFGILLSDEQKEKLKEIGIDVEVYHEDY